MDQISKLKFLTYIYKLLNINKFDERFREQYDEDSLISTSSYEITLIFIVLREYIRVKFGNLFYKQYEEYYDKDYNTAKITCYDVFDFIKYIIKYNKKSFKYINIDDISEIIIPFLPNYVHYVNILDIIKNLCSSLDHNQWLCIDTLTIMNETDVNGLSYKVYKHGILNIISQNPYQLNNIDIISGFTIDEMKDYLEKFITKTSPRKFLNLNTGKLCNKRRETEGNLCYDDDYEIAYLRPPNHIRIHNKEKLCELNEKRRITMLNIIKLRNLPYILNRLNIVPSEYMIQKLNINAIHEPIKYVSSNKFILNNKYIVAPKIALDNATKYGCNNRIQAIDSSINKCIVYIRLDDIKFKKWQKDRYVKNKKIISVTQTVRPIKLVRNNNTHDGTKYTLEDGNHRCYCCKELGYKYIPAIIVEGDIDDSVYRINTFEIPQFNINNINI